MSTNIRGKLIHDQSINSPVLVKDNTGPETTKRKSRADRPPSGPLQTPPTEAPKIRISACETRSEKRDSREKEAKIEEKKQDKKKEIKEEQKESKDSGSEKRRSNQDQKKPKKLNASSESDEEDLLGNLPQLQAIQSESDGISPEISQEEVSSSDPKKNSDDSSKEKEVNLFFFFPTFFNSFF